MHQCRDFRFQSGGMVPGIGEITLKFIDLLVSSTQFDLKISDLLLSVVRPDPG